MAPFVAPSNATEVIPRLWQGGKPAPGCYSFDLIVLVDDEYQPEASSFPCSRVLRIPLSDYRLPTPEEYVQARLVAETVVAWYRAGNKILVTCGAGLNRSGLITGLTMKMLGYQQDDLIRLIRQARGDRAIRNTGYLAFIAKISSISAPSVWPVVVLAGYGLLFSAIATVAASRR